jgi:glucosylceramidase
MTTSHNKPHRLWRRPSRLAFILIGLAFTACLTEQGHSADGVNWWLTTPQVTNRLTERGLLPFDTSWDTNLPALVVDPKQKYQTVDGFGFALTGGSAEHLIAMSPDHRAAILREIFSTDGNGLGVSYLRLSIGSSDLNSRVFSYDDLPPGETDPQLEKFDLSDDRINVIPVLTEILQINPKIKLLGSPWSAPLWMKTNQGIQGGKLKPECYEVYARYFVKYVQAMAQAGIRIEAVTVQNEPFNDGNTPSMQMFPKEEAQFVAGSLGPAFRAAHLKTKILVYDHNCDAPEYPVSILTDANARPFVDGSAFHLYAGPISALSLVHDRFPKKNIYFTEMMVVNRHAEFNAADPVSRILIGAMRNWSRNVVLWNLAADSQFKPHTDNGGCPFCQGAITIDGDQVERNEALYVMGHASKFVPPGSRRIASTESTILPNVAFHTPAGKLVSIVANPGREPVTFRLQTGRRAVRPELPAESVATFVW